MDKYEKQEFLILFAQVIASILAVFGFVVLCAFVSMWFMALAVVGFMVLVFGPDFMDIVEERAHKKREADLAKQAETNLS